MSFIFVQGAERHLQEYRGLWSPEHSHGPEQAVCDRCLQPIDDEAFRANVARMEADVASAAAKRRQASQKSSATQVCSHLLCVSPAWRLLSSTLRFYRCNSWRELTPKDATQ